MLSIMLLFIILQYYIWTLYNYYLSLTYKRILDIPTRRTRVHVVESCVPSSPSLNLANGVAEDKKSVGEKNKHWVIINLKLSLSISFQNDIDLFKQRIFKEV